MKYRTKDEEINALETEIEQLESENARLREVIKNVIEGNYQHPRSYRPKPCPHGKYWWEECDECLCEYLSSALEE